jgi:HlyD family secretion protein
MKKSWVFGLVLVLAVMAAGAVYFVQREKQAAAPTYRTDKIDRGDIVVSISATGTLNAVTTVQVGTQVSGTIARLFADFNSVVREGQLLALLDSTFLKASVNEQQANVERARAQVHDAQRNFTRMTKLVEKALVAQAEVDAAETAVETAQAGLKQAQASLDRATVNLRYATITAPISGVVISRNVDVGQTVAASLQAPTLFTIANDLRQMQVEASVDEADIGTVKEAQKVTFRVDAYPDDQFEGMVSQVRLSPNVEQGVVTYSVIIDVPNHDLKLMPGMTATVTIIVAERKDVLRAPLAAVKFTPPTAEKTGGEASRSARLAAPGQEGGRTRPAPRDGAMAAERPDGRPPHDFSEKKRGRIWLIENGQPKPYFIERGIQNTKYVELVGAELPEGTEVIIGTNSVKTQVTNQTNPFAPQMPGRGMRGGGR